MIVKYTLKYIYIILMEETSPASAIVQATIYAKQIGRKRHFKYKFCTYKRITVTNIIFYFERVFVFYCYLSL